MTKYNHSAKEAVPDGRESFASSDSLFFSVEDTFSDRLPQQVLGRSVEIALSTLPDIPAPSLGGVSITVPPPKPITEEYFAARLEALQLQHALHFPRMPGEAIQEGDLVVLNVVGYANQAILPFGAQKEMKLHIVPRLEFPGFTEALIGLSVGDVSLIHVTLPDHFPLVDFRGEVGAFAVELLEVYRLEPLDLEQPEQRARLHMGETLNAVMANLLEQIEEELTESLLRRATRMMLERLSEQVKVSLPDKLVDEEIRQHWLKREGLFLQFNEIDAEDMEASLASWLSHQGLREEAKRRLKFAVIVRSVAEQLAPPIEDYELDEFLDGLAEKLGLSSQEARDAMHNEPQTFQQLIDKFMYVRTLDYMLAQVDVEFADPT